MLSALNNISIVMLHYVSDEKEYEQLKPWNITHSSYLQLLDYLEAENYKTIVFEDILKDTYDKKSKNVMITFDDCPKHLLTFAVPELNRRNMKAVFYIPTANLGGYNTWGVEGGMPKVDLMDDVDIVELLNRGMEVGSHAHNHEMLDEKSIEKVHFQLSESKNILEAIIGKDVLSVAYPYGALPKNYNEVVAACGYHYGVSVYSPFESKYSLRRWVYDDTDTVDSIKKKLSFTYRLERSVNDKVNPIVKYTTQKAYREYSKIKSKIIT